MGCFSRPGLRRERGAAPPRDESCWTPTRPPTVSSTFRNRPPRSALGSADSEATRHGHRPVQAAPADRRGGHGHGLHGRADPAGAADRRAQAHQGRHGQPPGARPVRGRAPGPGPDGPPQHRQGLRRRHDRHGPSLLRHGAGQGHPDHPVLRRTPADDSASGSSWPSRSARPCSTPTRRGSSTATSSRRTS